MRSIIRVLAILVMSICPTLSYPDTYKDKDVIYYHVKFPVPVPVPEKGELPDHLKLDTDNYTDLVMSNFVAGAMYGHLIKKHMPSLQFDKDYLYGSLFAQLLQENIATSSYVKSSDYINPNPNDRKTLLSPGQGGPYQLNYYSARLESHFGLINFAVLQKSLGYTIHDQDSGIQWGAICPDSLDKKYFGPLATAYFQYNVLLILETLNRESFSDCIENFKEVPANFLDMILNAGYNAGSSSRITDTYVKICANYNDSAYREAIAHINDYSLDDASYQKAVNTTESAGSTFIIYPRQIRYYLDQLYNRNPTPFIINNNVLFALESDNEDDVTLEKVFAESMHTLAYKRSEAEGGKYGFIEKADAIQAFKEALVATLNDSTDKNPSLSISDADGRQKIFSILERAIQNLESRLTIDFAKTTNDDLDPRASDKTKRDDL
jgi:hypothetical protein